MRAVRLHGPRDLRLDDVPRPKPRSGEVLVEVEACGVCGSDLHFVDGSARTSHLPVTLGHEVAGRVAASADPAWQPGDVVVVELATACGDCRRCEEGRPNLCERTAVIGIDVDGGLADAVVAPASALVRRPEQLTPSAAATAVDAGATAWHAVTRRAGVDPGVSVLVIGVGGLGAYGVQFAKLAGATPVIAADVEPASLDLASTLGADEVIHVEEGSSLGRATKLLTDGGVDVAIEFVGRARTAQDAVKSIRPGGRALVVGVGDEPITTLPPVLWSNHEYTLTGAYGSLPGDAETVLGHLAAGRVIAPPTEVVSIDEAAEVIVGAAAGERRTSGRLVVSPSTVDA